MADKARKATDKRLEQMERHLSAIYYRTNKELTEKANNFFEQFKEMDEKKRALVESGKLDKEEYRRWRRTKIFQGKHWTKMKEQSAQMLLNTNQIATAYINGELPSIYVTNYNFSAGQIERGCSHAISFEMANEQTVKELTFAGQKSYFPQRKIEPAKDKRWNMRKINAEMLQGIRQGESIPEIASRFQSVGVANRNSAIRAARTFVTTVENKARQDTAEKASEKGVVLEKCWLTVSDERTREWHMDAGADYGSDDKSIPIDQPFIVGGEEMMFPGDPSASGKNVWNCRCSRRNVVKGFKSILPPEKRGKIKVKFL
jgi:hypothetical protein